MIKKNNKKKFPHITSDREAEKFVEEADLSEYDFSGFKKVNFEFEPKSRPISVRLPESLYSTVKQKAKQEGIKTQKFIRKALERAVS